MTDAASEKSEGERHAGIRRPYSKPGVVDSAVFETLAASCGKTSNELLCQFTGDIANS